MLTGVWLLAAHGVHASPPRLREARAQLPRGTRERRGPPRQSGTI